MKNCVVNPGIKNIFMVFAILAISSLISFRTEAQQPKPQFLTSWQASSYAPPWYQGKLLPTKGTTVEVKFELIDQGKIADLSKSRVRWYVDDQLTKNEDNGLGIKALKFEIPDSGGSDTEMRIAVLDYKGGEELDDIVRIPVRSSEVVIDSNLPNRQISTGDNLFYAIPFFFNVNSLGSISFNWLANGKSADSDTDRPWILNLNLDSRTPSGFFVDIQVTARNVLNQLEFGTGNAQFTVK